LKSFLVRVVPSVLVMLAVWQAVALVVHSIRGVLFPTPWQTMVRLYELFSGDLLADYSIIEHTMSSLKLLAAGFMIAAVCGVTYGVLAGRFRAVEYATAHIPQFLLSIPGLAWIPVAILMFGIGPASTIFMISIASFGPIAINVFSGIRGVDISFIRAAEMLGAGRNTLFFKVLIPAALPSVLSGLRIGFGTGLRVLVAAEMVLGLGAGLGYSIIQSRWTLDYASAFACIVIICAIGLFLEQLVFKNLEQRTVRTWSQTLK
jgi:ABC-type nitrate/sulfonate/bicarbonate transport system permease component